MRDNYAAVRESWRERFLTMDHAALAERFRGSLTDDALCVRYFSREYRVSRVDGAVRRADRPNDEVGFNEEMDILNMFHYAVPHPVASGRMVPFREVKRAYPFETAYRKSVLGTLAATFTGHVDELREAFAALRAEPVAQGDAGGSLEIIPGLRMTVTFWDGDDEFPAQANMLFDANITDFMHEENVVGVASDAVFMLSEAAGLTRDDRLFGENG